MWPNFSGMMPLNVLSCGAKAKSEKTSSVVPLGSWKAIASPMPGVMSLRRSHLTSAFFNREAISPRSLPVALENDRFQSGFGSEDRAVFLPGGEAQTDDASKIVDHPFEIGSCECRMACPLDLQHEALGPSLSAKLYAARRVHARVLFAEMPPTPRILSCSLGITLRHHVVWRPDRPGLAIACRLDANFFHLNIVGRTQIRIACDFRNGLPRPGEIGGDLLQCRGVLCEQRAHLLQNRLRAH